jgi:hypothetical protein
MRKIREETLINKEKDIKLRQIEMDNNLAMKFPSHSMNLLSIEDYFG